MGQRRPKFNSELQPVPHRRVPTVADLISVQLLAPNQPCIFYAQTLIHAGILRTPTNAILNV